MERQETDEVKTIRTIERTEGYVHVERGRKRVCVFGTEIKGKYSRQVNAGGGGW
jgi:hypothetical protein